MINKESYYGVEFTATLRANLEKISENLWANHIFKDFSHLVYTKKQTT
jgi:hypothetical protein